MNLNEWAIRWGVPYAALDDLRRQMTGEQTSLEGPEGRSEAAVQNAVRLEASRAGGRLWRNNVGVLNDDRGVPVRYGLCNDSAALNKVCKSSDLIGIRPVLIQPGDVGRVFGQFMAREVKAGGWRYAGTAREQAQLRFIELVNGLGGDAAFAAGEGTI